MAIARVRAVLVHGGFGPVWRARSQSVLRCNRGSRWLARFHRAPQRNVRLFSYSEQYSPGDLDAAGSSDPKWDFQPGTGYNAFADSHGYGHIDPYSVPDAHSDSHSHSHAHFSSISHAGLEPPRHPGSRDAAIAARYGCSLAHADTNADLYAAASPIAHVDSHADDYADHHAQPPVLGDAQSHAHASPDADPYAHGDDHPRSSAERYRDIHADASSHLHAAAIVYASPYHYLSAHSDPHIHAQPDPNAQPAADTDLDLHGDEYIRAHRDIAAHAHVYCYLNSPCTCHDDSIVHAHAVSRADPHLDPDTVPHRDVHHHPEPCALADAYAYVPGHYRVFHR